jgi:GrpB-like predicted nucleotidyltransferase (UPF0157 family)
MSVSQVVIVDYSSEWPALFEVEHKALATVFSPSTVRIEHIGSTSVPGLGAKPIIDILLGTPAIGQIEGRIAQLEHLGYRYFPEFEKDLPDRRYFDRLPQEGVPVHLHAVEVGSAFWREHLAFRDALRGDRVLADRYLELKRRLSRTFGTDRAGYTDAKAPFIREVIHASHRRA